MRTKIKFIVMLLIIALLPSKIIAQSSSVKKEKSSKDIPGKNAISHEESSPYIMNVKIKKIKENKKVVSSAVIEENKIVNEKNSTKNKSSKKKGLRLRKTKKTNKINAKK